MFENNSLFNLQIWLCLNPFKCVPTVFQGHLKLKNFQLFILNIFVENEQSWISFFLTLSLKGAKNLRNQLSHLNLIMQKLRFAKTIKKNLQLLKKSVQFFLSTKRKQK